MIANEHAEWTGKVLTGKKTASVLGFEKSRLELCMMKTLLFPPPQVVGLIFCSS